MTIIKNLWILTFQYCSLLIKSTILATKKSYTYLNRNILSAKNLETEKKNINTFLTFTQNVKQILIIFDLNIPVPRRFIMKMF